MSMTAEKPARIDVQVGEWVEWVSQGKTFRGKVQVVQDSGLLVRRPECSHQETLRWELVRVRKVDGPEAEVPSPESRVPSPSETLPLDDGPAAGTLLRIPIGEIVPFHLQPRRSFDPERLAELAASIREDGQQTPVSVRPASPRSSKPWELIAGERRLKACELADVGEVLAINRGPVSDLEALKEATIENAQREDLNDIEIAQNISYLAALKVNQAEIGRLLGGKSQEWVSRTHRLLSLPEPVQDMVRDGRLSASHARALLPYIQEPAAVVRMAELAVERGVSVRSLEDGIPFGDELKREGLLGSLEPPPTLPMDDPEPESSVAEDVESARGSFTTESTEDTEAAGEVDATGHTPPGDAAEPVSEPSPPIDGQYEAPEAPPAEEPRVVKSAAEIAAENAAQRTADTAPPPAEEPKKTGALKTAEEKVAEQKAAAAEPPKPAPVTFPIMPDMAERIKAAGLGVLPALRYGCTLAEIAKERGSEPQLALKDLETLYQRCADFGEPAHVVLRWLDNLAGGTTWEWREAVNALLRADTRPVEAQAGTGSVDQVDGVDTDTTEPADAECDLPERLTSNPATLQNEIVRLEGEIDRFNEATAAAVRKRAADEGIVHGKKQTKAQKERLAVIEAEEREKRQGQIDVLTAKIGRLRARLGEQSHV